MESKDGCQSCGKEISGKFCAHCGARAVPESHRDLLKEIIFVFTDLEKRFVHTVKMMLVSPGTLFKEYLVGERAKYFPPVRFLMVSLIVSYLWFKFTQMYFTDGRSMYEQMRSGIELGYETSSKGDDGKIFSEENFQIFFTEFMYWMNFFYKALVAVSIPLAAVVTRVVYKKMNYKFLEYLIMQVYTVSMNSIIIVLFGVITLFLPVNAMIHTYISFLPLSLYYGYVFYMMSKEHYKRPMLRCVISVLVLVGLYILLNMIFGSILMVYLKNNMPPLFVSP